MSAVPPPEGLSEAEAELLSALADGELRGAERTEADALLERSAAARAEYSFLHRAKQAVRGLPDVEPPEGFFEQLLAAGSPRPGPVAVAPYAEPAAPPPVTPPPPADWVGDAGAPAPVPAWPTAPVRDELAERRRRRVAAHGRVAAAAAGVAAAAVLVGGVVGPEADVRPPLEDVAVAQDGSDPAAGSGPLRPGGQGFQALTDGADLGEHPAPVEELDTGAALVDTFVATSGQGVLGVYEQDGERIVVYRQEGTLAWDELPEGVRSVVDGDDVWEDLTTEGGFERVVVARGDALYTLAGDVDPDVLIDVALELPAQEPSPPGVLERFRRAARGLVDLL